MKTKTTTTIVCALTDKEIGSVPAVVLQGRICKLLPDGTAGEVLLESGEGDAYLLSAFVEKVRSVAPTTPRAPRQKVEATPEAELLKAIKAAGGTVGMAKLKESMPGQSESSIKKGIEIAIEAGTIVRHAKGVYGLPAKTKAA